jgi:hypothetical protein
MLSVTYKPLMLSTIMLNVIILNVVMLIMLNVVMLHVILLIVVMLSVVAPFRICSSRFRRSKAHLLICFVFSK